MEEGHIATPPSRKTLLMLLSSGVMGAAVLLTCVVLPAEYGIDPLGTGKALGLAGIGQTAPATKIPETSEGATILPMMQPGMAASRWGESAVVKGAFIAQDRPFNVDSRDITLMPGQGIEIKYHLKKGAGLVYSWTASNPVLFDFHAEPDVKPANAGDSYSESYQRDDVKGAKQSQGTLIAPSAGIHGWFWENTGSEAVKLKLVTAGFYDWIYHSDEFGVTKLKPTSVNSLASHPQVPDDDLP